MHSTALVPFFFALLVAGVVGFDQSAQPSTFGVSRIVVDPYTGRPFGDVTRPDGPERELGGECDEEGRHSCDEEYNNAIICESGIWALKEKCALKACYWYNPAFGNDAGCADPEPPTPTALVASSYIDLGCSATFSIGANCGSDPALEGAMSCDTTCNNVGICHNGVFQVNSPCSPGRCQWREEVGQPFCV